MFLKLAPDSVLDH